MKRKMCKDCSDYVFQFLDKLDNQAKKNNRGGMIRDAIADLRVCLEDGSMKRIIERDEAYKSGKRIGRRIKD